MTTNDEQYVPSENEMRRAYRISRMFDHYADVDAAFDRFLAHVRREVAREALEELADEVRAEWDREHRWVASVVGAFRDNHYPEMED